MAEENQGLEQAPSMGADPSLQANPAKAATPQNLERFDKDMAAYKKSSRAARDLSMIGAAMAMTGNHEMADPIMQMGKAMVTDNPLEAMDASMKILAEVHSSGGDVAQFASHLEDAGALPPNWMQIVKTTIRETETTDARGGKVSSYTETNTAGTRDVRKNDATAQPERRVRGTGKGTGKPGTGKGGHFYDIASKFATSADKWSSDEEAKFRKDNINSKGIGKWEARLPPMMQAHNFYKSVKAKGQLQALKKAAIAASGGDEKAAQRLIDETLPGYFE